MNLTSCTQCVYNLTELLNSPCATCWDTVTTTYVNFKGITTMPGHQHPHREVLSRWLEDITRTIQYQDRFDIWCDINTYDILLSNCLSISALKTRLKPITRIEKLRITPKLACLFNHHHKEIIPNFEITFEDGVPVSGRAI